MTKKLTCEVPGLGDSLTDFKVVHGLSRDGSALKSFRNDEVVVMFIDDLACNVSLLFEKGKGLRVTKETAWEAINQFIPKDATKIGGSGRQSFPGDVIYKNDFQKDYQVFKSEELARIFTEYYNNPIVPQSYEAGTFVVQLKYDDRGVFSVIAALGNNP